MRSLPLAATLTLCLLLAGAVALAVETATVTRVVDGDTLVVQVADREERVRLIGVDTPETVHPNKPVERFGKEASTFTKRMVEGRVVRLKEDPESTNRDKYGRLLRYVFLPDGRLLNAELIAQGYGHAYTRFPFTRMEEFRALERQAREGNRGLWGDTDAPAPAATAGDTTAIPAEPVGVTDTVYVTRTGTKYHRQGCRYLARSSIPIALKDAAGRYGPCSVCTPPAAPSAVPVLAQPTGPGGGATPTPKAAASEDRESQTVFVTRTGTKYHRAGCRYLAKSMIPTKLKDAAARYGPCSVCSPPTLNATGAAATSPTRSPPSVAGRCQAITQKGTQCKRNASPGSRYCWQHQR